MLTQQLMGIALLSTEWIIGFLMFLSVLALAIIFERLIILQIRGGSSLDSSLARIEKRVRTGFINTGLPFEDALAVALSEEKLLLERRIAVLGTLGSNAPYIGLLGTVLGIIHAFHNLSLHVQGGPSVILTGISEALVATALGLFVAIPSVIAYNYFVRAIRKILVNAENVVRARLQKS